MRRVHLRIDGHVQGVSFRYAARRQASTLHLTGWIRNCPNGTVEVVLQGEDDAVSSFLQWAHHGPSGADVQRVDAADEELAIGETGFRIVS